MNEMRALIDAGYYGKNSPINGCSMNLWLVKRYFFMRYLFCDKILLKEGM